MKNIFLILSLLLNLNTLSTYASRGPSNDTKFAIGETYIYSLSKDGKVLSQYLLSDLSLVNSTTLTGKGKSITVSVDTPLVIVKKGKKLFTLNSFDSSTLAETGSLSFDRKKSDIDDDDDSDDDNDSDDDDSDDDDDDSDDDNDSDDDDDDSDDD
jgi:hypothetical protein